MRPTDIVALLRLEANCTEELHPQDSEIEVMRDAAGEIERLRSAARLARSALDRLMGDSDLPEDDSPEMKAMQALSAVLPDPV